RSRSRYFRTSYSSSAKPTLTQASCRSTQLNVASKLLLLADSSSEIIGYQENQANHSSTPLRDDDHASGDEHRANDLGSGQALAEEEVGEDGGEGDFGDADDGGGA